VAATSALRAAVLCVSLACAGGLPGAEQLQADVLADWADLHYELVKADGTLPPRAAREYGCVPSALTSS
jgi:hypothetical protein